MELTAKEERCPLWAAIVPAVYVLACAAAARAIFREPGAEVGISGLLAAVGLLPAFAMPAIFTTCKTKLTVSLEGLGIGGRPCTPSEVVLQHGERGSAVLQIVFENGRRRAFVVDSYRDASRLVEILSPSSAPAKVPAAESDPRALAA